MKIKKLNMALAVLVAGGGLVVLNSGPAENLKSAPVAAESMSGNTGAAGLWTPVGAISTFGERFEANDFSPIGKKVTTIAWSSLVRAEQMPSQPVLSKWNVGNRTFYQMTGPINPHYVGKPVGVWNTYVAYEVFFRRDGRHYDQWLLGAPENALLHLRDENLLVATAHVPSSRYRQEIQGDRATVTFWCYSNDTPANIVFNYNLPGDTLAWCATEQHRESPNHHLRATWGDP